MNRKTTTIRKFLPKLILILALVVVLAVSMSSCGNSTTINIGGLDYWAGTTETESDTNETETDSDETDSDESDSNETDSAESETGSDESDTAESETQTGTEKETESDVEGGAENNGSTGGKKDVILENQPNLLDNFLLGIGRFMNWITRIMPWHSYLLTLFVFAILFEIVMLPFSIKQQKNSIRQARLKPKEMAIRKKYAGRNDAVTMQKVNQEIQELYQKENFNPMSGCFPLLVQLPIIIILYSLVIDPIKYVMNASSEFTNFMYRYLEHIGEKFNTTNGSVEVLSKISEIASREDGMSVFEGVKDFCANGDAVIEKIQGIADVAPNFNIGPLNLGMTPSFNPTESLYWLLILVPILTFVVQFFSMRLSRKFTFQPGQDGGVDRQTACSNNMMDVTMPLMSVWIAFIVPAIVGIYWIFKGIIGTVKQYIMSRVMPLPQFTEEDYKAAERELLGKQPKKIQKSANAGKVRSLHHIDDEDYDEFGNYIPQKEEEEVPEEKPVEKLPENNMTEGASLKDDSDRNQGEKKSWFGKKDKKD